VSCGGSFAVVAGSAAAGGFGGLLCACDVAARFEHASHIILYQPLPDGIRIERIIRNRQLIEPHLH
jgi:hypothetical protein